MIVRSCRLKADVVEADEREETGARAVLNYGHTFGHALEAVTGYGTLLHGEAVAIGMVAAARLSRRLQLLDAAAVERQQKLLSALGLPVAVPVVDHDAMLAAMQHDKKVAARPVAIRAGPARSARSKSSKGWIRPTCVPRWSVDAFC